MTSTVTKFSRKALVISCSLCFAGGVAYGQQYAPAPGTGASGESDAGQGSGGSGAAGIRLEPFVLYPSVTVKEGYTDNLTYQNTNRLASALTVVSPALLAELKGSTTTVRLAYLGTFGRYDRSSVDNYDYHEFRGSADFDFTARSRLNLVADYLIKADPRGFTVASTGTASQNKYHLWDIGGTYSYGAAGAQGRIEVETLFTQKRYENNRLITDTLDYDAERYGATFFWRVGPKTEWLIEGTQVRTDYISSAAVLDNTDTRVLTGLKWEATALTSGTAKFGYNEKRYTNAASPQRRAKGGVWEIGIRWSPLTYSVVDVATGRRFVDSQAGGGSSFADAKYITVAWSHGWSERLRSTLSGTYEEDSYAGIVREDKVGFVNTKLEYDMRRWLTFGAEYRYSQRDTNLPGLNYKQNIFLLSVKATL